MRFSFLMLGVLLICPMAAHAVDAPAGQVKIDANHILRGRFVDTRQVPGFKDPMISTGSFVVAPGHGLLWQMEKPMATTTIITADSSVQDIGGMAIRLPIKNLRHLYAMVGGALSGDWSALEEDFVIKPSGVSGGDAHHWQMLLMARPNPANGKPKTPYTTITVNGGAFVENIVMTKADGSADMFSFSNAALAPAPLSVPEMALFGEAVSSPH